MFYNPFVGDDGNHPAYNDGIDGNSRDDCHRPLLILKFFYYFLLICHNFWFKHPFGDHIIDILIPQFDTFWFLICFRFG